MDIPKMFQDATKHLQEFDHYIMPEVYIEFHDSVTGKDAMEMFFIQMVADAHAQRTLLFSIGRDFGKKQPKHTLQRITLLAEIWTSFYKANENAPVEPVKRKDRREVIYIEEVNLLTPGVFDRHVWFADIQRDTRGHFLALSPEYEPERFMQNSMIYYLYNGILSAQYSDEQLAQLLNIQPDQPPLN